MVDSIGELTDGTSHLEQSLDALKEGGTLISLSVLLDRKLSLAKKALAKKVSMFRLGVASSAADMEAIAALLQEGSLHSHISATYALHEMAAAHQQVESGRTRGKIINDSVESLFNREIATNRRNSFDSNTTMPASPAPNTFRTPISFVRLWVAKVANPNSPRQEITITNKTANTLNERAHPPFQPYRDGPGPGRPIHMTREYCHIPSDNTAAPVPWCFGCFRPSSGRP